MEFCFGLCLTHGSKTSVSWIILPFLCSMLCMWSSVDGWSYHYSNTTMDWEKAREWCREHYTDMVAIQNQEEINHLNTMMPYIAGYFWIGIRKINNVWTWVGTNKSLTVEATNWAKNEPNNGKRGLRTRQEDCVEMYIKRKEQTGKWNDERCSKRKTALCYTAACKNDSCQNGECVETINSHRCSCFKGFYGDRCEHVVTCSEEEVTVPLNGNVSCSHKHGDFSYDSVCQYSCEQGYQLNMSRPMKCTESGKWSEQPPTCELVMCKELSHPERGSMNCTDPLGPSTYQSSCEFTCDKGYVLNSPSDTLRCEESGTWSSSQPSCVAVQCPVLQELENGFTNCEGEDMSYGSTCSFSCISGYRLVGPSSTTCTSAAVWNERMPQCEVVRCPFLEAPENGHINCSSTDQVYNSQCSFTCSPDYSLHGHDLLTCDRHGSWTGEKPTCQAPLAPVAAITSSVTAGGVLSGLSAAAWVIKRLRRRENKFELSSNSDIDTSPQVYKNSIDSLL